MEKIRTLVRPILTVTGWFALIYLAIVADGNIRQTFVTAVSMMVAFWFGQRRGNQ